MPQSDKILNKKLEELESIYLVYSEEKYLLEEFIKKFEIKFIAENIKDFNLSYLNDDNPQFIEKLKKNSFTLPSFSEKRFIIANCKNYFTKKSNEDKKLIKLFENFPETTILIILVSDKIDNRIKVNKVIKKAGKILELNPPKYNNLDNWIINNFNDYNKNVDSRGVNLLEEMFNNNLQLLKNEIEKINTCYLEKDYINLEDIRKIISRDKSIKENIIFSLTDALSERKKDRALLLYNEMIKNGESPLMILSMINRQIRLLIQVKELKKMGFRHKKIAKKLGEHPYPIKKCYTQVNNFSSEELEILLERFLEANLDILKGKYKKKERAIEMALLNI